MGLFYKTSKMVLNMNAAVLALFAFGPGLTPPNQASVGPSSDCAAPLQYYEKVAFFHFIFLYAILGSCILAGLAILAVAVQGDESLVALSAAARLTTRVTLLLAILLSAVAATCALTVYCYILQIRYTTFACMVVSVRAVVFGAQVLLAVVCAYAYVSFARTAFFDM